MKPSLQSFSLLTQKSSAHLKIAVLVLTFALCAFNANAQCFTGLSWTTEPTISSPSGAFFFSTVGDFNGDGKMDLVTGASSGAVCFVKGNGDGTFAAATIIVTSGNYRGVTSGDFDGDGKLDIAIANQTGTSNNVVIYKGNGNGTFTSAGAYTAGNSPYFLVVADFNNDGKPDIAAANDGSGSTTISILFNNGAGSFTSSTNLTVSSSGSLNPQGVVAGDFNNDGNMDIASVNNSDNTVKWAMGNGNGTFGAVNSITVPFSSSNPCYVATGDFDGDGNLDLVVANRVAAPTANLYVLKGNGSGGFSTVYPGSPFTAGASGNQALYPVVADVNNDGHPDILVGCSTGSGISVLLNNGTGGFAVSNIATASSMWSETAADINGDGKIDIIGAVSGNSTIAVFLNATATASVSAPSVACSGASLSLTGGPSSGVTYAWSGPGGFTSTSQSPTVGSPATGKYSLTVTASGPCTASASVAVAVFTTPAPFNQTVTACGSYSVGSSVHTSSGTYTDHINSKHGCDSAVVTNLTINTIGTFSQTLSLCGGQSVMVGSVTHNATGTYVDRITGGSHDGCDSIVTTNLTVFYGSGSAAYGTANFPSFNYYAPNSSQEYGFTTGDFNGDGKPDLATANLGNGSATVLFNNGSGVFTSTATVTAAGATGVAMADFDGDGKMDLAVCNTSGNTVFIFLGNGSGGFKSTTPFSTTATGGTGAWTPIAADFNGDGKMDLAVSNGNGGSTISILMGNGNGTLSPATNYTVGSGDYSMILGDFNNDGKLDLATVNQNANTVTILKGNGDGTFNVTPISFSTSPYNTPHALAAADFNGDGKLDFAVVVQSSTNLVIYLANSTGGYTATAASPYTIGSNPQDVKVGDFNGDGILDLATANYSGNTVSILLGNGTGGFSTATTLPTTTAVVTNTNPQLLAVADFNGDGKPDLAASNYAVTDINVWLNATSFAVATATPVNACSSGTNSTLTLTAAGGLTSYSWSGPNGFTSSLQTPTIVNPATAASGIYTLSITDAINSSVTCTATSTTGTITVSQAKTFSQTISACGSYTVGASVHTSSGTYTDVLTQKHSSCDSTVTTNLTINNIGTFTQTLNLCAGQSVLVGSVTHNATGTYVDRITGGSHDGCDSIVTTNLTIFYGSGSAAYGTANFPTFNYYAPAASQEYGFTTGDFNGDGKPDLATGNLGAGNATVLFNNGSGVFTSTASVTYSGAVAVAMGDFDGDGKMDLVVCNTNTGANNVSIFLGNGSGGFKSTTPFSNASTGLSGAWTAIAADFNGDGKMDVAVSNGNGGSAISILLGNGNGTLSSATNYTVASGDYEMILGDFNNDGKLDLATANQNAMNFTILKGNGDGTFNPTPITVPTTGGSQPHAITAGDFNGDGKLDVAIGVQNTTNLEIYLANSTGGYNLSAGSPYAIGNNPQDARVGDFNGDGILDVAISGYSSNTVSILIGNGTGGFSTATNLPTTTAIVTSTNPQMLAVADFNGDGKPDLAASNYNVADVNVWLNATTLASVTASPTNVCNSGTNSTLTLTAAAGLTSYRWSGPNSFTSSLQIPTIVNPTTAASGTYTLSVTDSHSCTAAATSPAITVNVAKTFSQTITACGSYTVGSIVHTSSGTYNDILTSHSGCDSTVTTNLTINSPAVSQSITLCPGQPPLTILSKTHKTTGTYIDRFTGAGHAGCDSLINTRLSVIFGAGGSASFSSATLATPNALYGSASADFNGDGKDDLVMVTTSNTIFVFLNNGSGGFTTSIPVTPVGSGPRGVITGDFNNDGHPDIVVSDQSLPGISLYLNNGFGTAFTKVNPDVSVGAGGNFYTIADDFNGDGNLDLATANENNHSVTVLLGNGSGGFPTSNTYTPSGTTTTPDIASGDFNGDGRPDIALMNVGTNNISILMNNGNGTFNTSTINTFSPTGINLGGDPPQIIAADFDHDGKFDLAVCNYNASNILVLRGDGTGHFTVMSTFTTASGPFALTSGDYNGDGILDIAVATRGTFGAAVFTGNGTGGFTSSFALNGATSPWPILTGDFNGDGKPDLAVANNSSATEIIYLNTASSLGAATASPNPVCTGGSSSTLNLNGTITGILTYKWIGPGGYSSSLQNPTIVHPTTAAAGTYTFVTTESHGCTISTNIPVVVNSPKTFSQTISACGSYTIGSTTHTGSGTFTDVINSVGGCDSTVTTNLTIKPLTFTTVSASICAGQSYTVGSATHIETGTYIDHIVGAAPDGCDIVQTTNLSVLYGSGGTPSFNNTPTISLSGNLFNILADFDGDGKPDMVVSNGSANLSYYKGNGDGTFFAATTIAGATTLRGLAAGDFDGDGKMDFIAANQSGSNNVFIYKGNGNGTFTTLTPAVAVNSPYTVAVGDFNNDGKPDMAVANNGTGATTVTVLLNNGAGAFSTIAGSSITAGAGSTKPCDITVNDFNSDGNLDLAFCNSSSTIITFAMGNGNGTFAAPGSFTLATALPDPSYLSSGDINGDGKPDIAVVNKTEGKIDVLIGNGSGGFTSGTPLTVSASPLYGAVIDVNGDGKPDVLSESSTVMNVLLNNGSGTFTAAPNVTVGTNPWMFTPADINNDGRMDVAMDNNGSAIISILLGNGTGGFGSTTNVAPSGLLLGACADFNGDGIPDVICSNSTANLQFLKGGANGTFTTGTAITTLASTVRGVVTGDFNGDGKMDLAVANQTNSGTTANDVFIFLGNGNGTFNTAPPAVATNSPYNLATADFNGDGKLDLAVADNGTGATTCTVLLGNGSGGFSTKPGSIITTSGGGRPCGVTINDFNNDGKPDVAICGSASGMVFFTLGNGDGTFGTVGSFNLSTLNTSNDPDYITSGDYDGDGNVDLAIANRINPGTVYILKGNGSGGFSSVFPGSPFTTGSNGPLYITTADFNGDGKPDIAVGNIGTNSVSILASNGTGGFNSAVTFTSISSPWSLIPADVNADGKMDLLVLGTGMTTLLNMTSSLAKQPTAGVTTPMCSNGTLTLTGAPNSLAGYSWSGPNFYSATGQNQSIVGPTLAGAGIYSLTVTDSRGCTGSVNSSSVVMKALPNISVTPASAVCLPATSAALTASGSVSGYTWSPIANLTPSAGTSATETAQISQLTFYTVTGAGSNGCSNNVVVPVATVATGGLITPSFSIICSGATKTLTVTGAAGHDYQWQISPDNSTWTNITGATNTTYTTASGDGTTNKFYRLMAQSNSCWNVASTTAEVDVSIPVIAVTASNVTDNSLTLNWSPTGSGNYTISYSGPSSATLTSVTPAKTITGLTANGSYRITVTQTGVGCAASGTVTGVTTLCAMPTGVTLSSPASSQILVSWTGVVGADYRVYYRPLFSYNTYFTKDVSNVSSVLLTKQGNNNLYASTTYEVYVSRLDCPTTGAVGQGTSPTNVTTLPNVSCATPSIDSVRSLCPVQIEVFIHDNGVNQYNVYIQRITPTVLAVNSYGVSGTYFTVNTPYSGDQYLIALEAKCGGALSNLYVWPGNVTIKPLCTSPNNLVLSNPTCHGFTASWNADQCLSNAASEYALYLREAGTINYNSYGVQLPANGIGPNKVIGFVTSGRTYQVYVRSIYNCNGFVTYGPSSLVQTITTLSSGCRDEDTQQPEETKPAVQQYSTDNQEVFSLYPNPNNGEFVVDLSRYSNEEDAVRIEVINIIGQTVITHLTTISGGHMNEFINLPNGTAAGTYMVRLTAGKNVYTAKINVSK